MSSVWFTSDTHFNHESMVTKGWRPGFQNVAQMNNEIREGWNDTVKPSDQVWHLGDVGMGSMWEDAGLVRELHGQKHLIAGNHDSCWPGHREAYKRQRDWMDLYGFLSVQAFARRKLGGQNVLLSHFPYSGDHTEGDRYSGYRLQDTGLWLIHGHVHDAWVTQDRMINVGVDVWDFTPVHIDTLAAIIREKS